MRLEEEQIPIAMMDESGDSSHFPGHVLVVDDEPFIRNAFKLYLETHGFEVASAAGGEEALEIFRNETNLDVILLDLVLPGFHGLELLRQFKIERSLVEVIIATGCGSMNSAIEALRLGAFDYVTKPIVDFDRDLLSVVQKAITTRKHKLDQVSSVRDHGDQADGEWLSESARFYDNLESLAASLIESTTRESALAIVESFLARQFATVGGVVSEHTAHSMSFRHGWGIVSDWVEAGFAPPDATEVDFWRPLLRSTSRWEQISTAVLFPETLRTEGANEEPLEILRIPLGAAQDASGQSTSLFIFRAQSEEDARPPPAGTALLALIVNAALSRSVVSLSV